MLSVPTHNYFKTIHTIEEDFPFLFKVVEFRILLLGLDKRERERYNSLWFAREKTFASMSRDQLERESKNYIGRLLSNCLNLTPKSREQLSQIYTSSLHRNLYTLTRGRLPGTELKEKENELLSELMAWVNTIEDETILAFVKPHFKKILEEEKTSFEKAMQYFWSFKIKTSLLFSSLDTDNNIKWVGHPNLQKSDDLWFELLINPFLDDSWNYTPRPIKLAKRLHKFLSKLPLLLLFMEFLDFHEKIPSAPYGLMSLGMIGFIYWGERTLGYYYNRNASLNAEDPVRFYEIFSPLINSFFQQVVKDLFYKERTAEYPYQPGPAELPFLRSLLPPSGFSSVATSEQKEEIAPKKEKKKTHARRFLQLDTLNRITHFFVPATKKESDNHTISIDANLTYVLMENNQYVKLDTQQLSRLFKSHYSKESPSLFIESVFSTLERAPHVDKVGEDEAGGIKGLYPGCSHKLRLNMNNRLFRVGLAVRPPTKLEEGYGITTEVYSPRVLTRGHKKGHTVR
ncbi:MAG: hypothetical protein K0S27_876 [Gammaproteobacteria bacterium]|jgi:hypothetical protein|nr:hypothetical protein [Gammaproteobacteria bacterium]